jgi:hypothetical protein
MTPTVNDGLPSTRKRYWLLGMLSLPLVFFLLCTNRIDGQGIYYDELHQAPAAFMLVGKPPYTFTRLSWGNIPLLTMPYGGATKSIIYGLWMKWTGLPFSLISWRILGIVLVMVGLVLFCGGAMHGLTPIGLLVFGWLFLTDITVLMTSRHDWGPTALSMALRLAWLGLWIKLESAPSIRRVDAFFFGLLPAFSVYEKLSNITFLSVFALVLCLSKRERYRKHRLPILVGFLIGLSPLILVNLLKPAISFKQALNAGRSTDFMQVVSRIPMFLSDTLSLGAGDMVRGFIMDYPIPIWTQRAELAFMITFMLGAAIISVLYWRQQREARLMLLSTIGYFLAATLTWMLPGTTWVHHWIVATPFQYLSLALLPTVVRRLGASTHSRMWTYGFLPTLALLLSCFLLVRTLNLWDTQKGLAKGMASSAWDPSYTRIARFATEHRDKANFILADWGFATAIYALSNGSFPVAEPFWNYHEREELALLLSEKPGKPIYVLSNRLGKPVNRAATEAIFRDINRMTHDHVMPVEDEIATLRSVQVLKFAYPD